MGTLTQARIHALLEEIGSGIHVKEEISWFNLHFNRFFETLILLSKFLSPKSLILDVGISPGYLAVAVKKLGYEVYGIDLNPRDFKERFKNLGIQVKRCDIESEPIPFSDNTFDCVLFTEILEHLKYYYIDNALNEIKRVLKRKGLLILSTPNLASLENRLFLLLGGSPYLGGGIISPAHNREYTLREVLDILQRVGFSVILHRYSMARDKVTHKSSDFIIREHVLKSFIKYKNWINVGRALVYPLKFAVPSLRSMFFIIAEKAE